jgi:hypothetical protein
LGKLVGFVGRDVEDGLSEESGAGSLQQDMRSGEYEKRDEKVRNAGFDPCLLMDYDADKEWKEDKITDDRQRHVVNRSFA